MKFDTEEKARWDCHSALIIPAYPVRSWVMTGLKSRCLLSGLARKEYHRPEGFSF